VRHGTCFRRRLSTHHAGAAPHSAVAELGVVSRLRATDDRNRKPIQDGSRQSASNADQRIDHQMPEWLDTRIAYSVFTAFAAAVLLPLLIRRLGQRQDAFDAFRAALSHVEHTLTTAKLSSIETAYLDSLPLLRDACLRLSPHVILHRARFDTAWHAYTRRSQADVSGRIRTAHILASLGHSEDGARFHADLLNEIKAIRDAAS